MRKVVLLEVMDSETVAGGRPDPVTRISALRRAFCLLALFDLIFTVILWLFYTRYLGLELDKAFKQQVLQYEFKTSVFDLILLSFFRFAILEIFYAALRIMNPYVVAVTTAGSTAFVIVKIIFYDYTHGHGVFDYLLPIVTLILVWAETFLLDCKVLPTERLASERAQGFTERSSLLRGGGAGGYQGVGAILSEGFRTPESSPEQSGDEEANAAETAQKWRRQASGAKGLSDADVSRFLRRADQLADEAWQCLTDTEWKCAVDRDAGRVLCQKSRHRSAGKAWRLEAILDLPAERMFEEIWDRVEHYPEWNRNVLFSKIAARLDANTTIVHNGTAEAGGGLVKARDFVTLCVRRQRDGVFYTGGVAIDTELVPRCKKYTRGENFPGCVACVPNGRSSCKLVWVMDSDLKGWLPSTVIDQAMTSVLSQLATSLQQLAAGIVRDERRTVVIDTGQ